ncbi:MAG: LacI family DNA-binding transcriptional regulator [Tenericutes bacterium]|nr:LacI family DNA-binding transcriptional regulator [Mycoplasmatota bacterium]
MVTIKDISRISGFSITTVSKALNDYPDIAKSTKEHIIKVCDEEGYIPNAQAQGLVSKKSYTIGIIFEEITGVGLQHPLFSKILESFKNEVEKLGYDIMFLSNSSLNKNNGSYYQHSIRKQVEAVLVLCADVNSEDMVELYNGEIPIVMIDFAHEKILNITSNNETGVKKAVEHLIHLNHKKIANIHGSLDTFIGDLRKAYFVGAMNENNLTVPEAYFANGEFFSKESGFHAMNELLKLEDQPTAIFCASDMLAIGAIQAIKKHGKKVPRDYSIIGFDGIEAGQLISPLLTTVNQDTKQMGKIAAKQILEMIKLKKQTKKGKTIEIETTLLEGETTRKL